MRPGFPFPEYDDALIGERIERSVIEDFKLVGSHAGSFPDIFWQKRFGLLKTGRKLALVFAGVRDKGPHPGLHGFLFGPDHFCHLQGRLGLRRWSLLRWAALCPEGVKFPGLAAKQFRFGSEF